MSHPSCILLALSEFERYSFQITDRLDGICCGLSSRVSCINQFENKFTKIIFSGAEPEFEYLTFAEHAKFIPKNLPPADNLEIYMIATQDDLLSIIK